MEFLTLALMGALAGVMAGLLGIGGGALIVPVLVIVFEMQKVDPGIIMQAALGTSLATIVFTAMSSIRAHHRRGAVNWEIFRRITPGIIIGSLVGAGIAKLLTSHALQIMFVVFMFAIAAQFARGTTAIPAHRRLPGAAGMTLAGLTIGIASALFGIGGGSLSVPFLTWCSVPVRQAIATSAAIGLPIALSSSLGYILAGWNDPRLPPLSIGYVVLPAFIGIVVASTLAAPLGARLAHRLSENTLRRLFALFVALLGVRMLIGLIK
ncbi:MAG: sulfite exporter TauE/SafE family protein [Gammaproteobacteria bacterium]|nr:sulfite exporter TauE/SafE family protein [Gammaproteobacteria bacterium]